MIGLVKKFEEKLEVSKRNAIGRVIAFIFCCVVFVTILVYSFVSIAYPPEFETIEYKIPLLFGNSNIIETEEILNGDIILNKETFIHIMKDNDIFVSLGRENIIYMINVSGLKYVHKQIIPVRPGYFIFSGHIQNGYVVIKMKFDAHRMSLLHAFLPALLLGTILFVVFYVINWKSSSIPGETAKTVWS